ncbi:MAG: carboxypeptidase regulatory-like domain-containing protein, partial [Myxococcales bacterium]|nr:carboxypeptidase regulatory-like domain-containing protein [Myxococcales bacterium]
MSLVAACASLAITSCAVDDAEQAGVESAILSQVFSGTVVDGNGTPVAGAQITINGILRVTSATGQYAVSVVDSRTGYRLDVRKDGFAPQTELRLAGALSLVHRLQSGFTRTIQPGVANTIVDPASGVQVTLPANSLRSNSGAPAGAVRFTIIPHTSQTMPGDFTARRASGAPVALVSV